MCVHMFLFFHKILFLFSWNKTFGNVSTIVLIVKVWFTSYGEVKKNIIQKKKMYVIFHRNFIPFNILDCVFLIHKFNFFPILCFKSSLWSMYMVLHTEQERKSPYLACKPNTQFFFVVSLILLEVCFISYQHLWWNHDFKLPYLNLSNTWFVWVYLVKW